jgi:hypothetical protein
MLQPEGFEVGGPDCICKLYKSLSLRSQASRWSLEQDIALHITLTALQLFTHMLTLHMDFQSNRKFKT